MTDDSHGTLPWQPIRWKKWQTPYFHRSGIQKRYEISLPQCKNFVNFGPVTSVLTELICERLVRHGQKTGLFSRISPDILDRFSQPFHPMKALWVQMMDLYLIFRFVKGRCHATQYRVDKPKLTQRRHNNIALSLRRAVSLLILAASSYYTTTHRGLFSRFTVG